ncbi:MAG: fructose-6-phosphate aldolase [Selenomonas sp.]|uniref:transaldolase family protein n=1 Tax=Selenomonas sp. TaxID=2053611 RepID=UPI0025F30BB4|nr:transaldolase family protein [Selenomonas sp.]MCI6100066.1 fructose-6-phosphate aldolase [Selenomonas sp.]MCI6233418.1 fructose-6-phosphate aldolase [Selenomonas sp.]
MKILIDDADIEAIKALYPVYPIDGVTTNPSILAKSGRQPYDVLKEIRAFIGEEAELHVQVVGRTADAMLADALRIHKELGANTYTKIPTNPAGLEAMKRLRKAQPYAHITATAIYTPMQAFLAAKAGADYAAPYINRIDNLGADGIQTAKIIQDMFTNNGLKCEILAASFKNSQQVQALAQYGVGAATIAPAVIEGLVKNAAVAAAIDDFTRDFEGLCGKGITMKDAN